MDLVTPAAAPVPAGGAPMPMRLSRLGDELLAHYVARGSDRAFAVLYERYHQPLYRYCRSILRDDSDAQDALQSTFTGALAALRREQRSAPLRPWLFRIAHNEAISLIRRRGRDTTTDHGSTEDLGSASSAEHEVAERARWTSLVEDLGRLPDRQRAALLLRELSGLSHEEIALALGTTTAAAKQAIFEARQSLAEIEAGRTMSCDDVRQRISEGDRRLLRGRRIKAHLRECAACEAFALSIPARQAQLRALTPGLPPAAAAALLARALGASCAHGGAGAGGASAAVGAGAATKAAGAAFTSKMLAGVALVATTAAGVAGLGHVLAHRHNSPAPVSRLAAQHHESAVAPAAFARIHRHEARAATAHTGHVRRDAPTRRHRHAAPRHPPRAKAARRTAARPITRAPRSTKAIALRRASDSLRARSAARTAAVRASASARARTKSIKHSRRHRAAAGTRPALIDHARPPTGGTRM